MKVALLTFLYDPEFGGGSAHSARRLAQGLRESGLDVIVVTTNPQRSSKVETIDGIKVFNIAPSNLYGVAEKDQQALPKKIVWQLIDIWNPDTYRKVRAILDLERPDIVHVQKLRGLSPSVWMAAHKSGCGLLIQTCRDYELMSPEGTLAGVIGELAVKQSWVLRPYQRLRARMSRRIDVATAPSAYTLRMLTDRGFFPNARHTVVANSHGFNNADLKSLRQASNRSQAIAGDNMLRFLYLGRLETIKGVDVLCSAFVRSARRYANITLDIVGSGTQEKTLRQAYGGHPKISFHGALHGKSKHSALATSDVMIVPSTWPEVFGLVVVEAFAYGMPVIASDIGGLSELVENESTGFLVPPRDVASLSQSLERFAAQPELARMMSPNCFAAAEQYSTENMTKQYLAAYRL